MGKTRKTNKKKEKSKTRKQKPKKGKHVKFGNTYRCVPANNSNKNNGKLITIDGDVMVVTKETIS